MAVARVGNSEQDTIANRSGVGVQLRFKKRSFGSAMEAEPSRHFWVNQKIAGFLSYVRGVEVPFEKGTF